MDSRPLAFQVKGKTALKSQYIFKTSRHRLFSSLGKVVAIIKTDLQGRPYSQKKVDSESHFLRKPPAIAYDATVIQQATKAGVVYHVVFDKHTGECWSAWHQTILDQGFELDRGYGRQIALDLKYWTQGATPEPIPINVQAERIKEQLDLFGEAM
jgi:hypothetical protein